MKILFVTMQYGRSYLQGTERYLGTLGRCLRERGHEVGYLAGDPLGVHAAERPPSRPLVLGDIVDATENIHALPTRGWMAVQGLHPAKLAEWLRGWRPDIVHIANPAHVGVGVVAACRQLGISYVITTMDFWWVCPKATLLRADGGVCTGCRGWAECTRCLAGSHQRTWARQLAKLPPGSAGVILATFYAKAAARGMSPRDLTRWVRRNAVLAEILSHAAAVIFPSRATWEAIRPRCSHDRCQIIPYGLSDEWFAAPHARPTTRKSPADLVIGFAGALMPHKGPHVLLKAVQRLGWRETAIRLAGPANDATYANRLHTGAQGLKVEFLGPVNAAAMPAFLRSLDLLVMPSVWPENLPFVVLEAQAAGVPVVASRLAGVAEQIGDDRLLFEPGSADGLAAALSSAQQSLTDIRLSRVNTVSEMTSATEELYRMALAGH